MTAYVRFVTAMLCAALGTGTLLSQATASGGVESPRLQVGASFTYTLAETSGSSRNRFGLKGGGIDAAYLFGGKFRRMGVAIDGNAATASNIEPGVSLSQFSILAGPRLLAWRGGVHGHRTDLYGQALFGEVHGFDGLFPSLPSGLQSSANSLGIQPGCGITIAWTRRLSLRPVEVDYLYSRLPNNANNAQNNLRLSTGVVFTFR